jgi:hypothetical protein
MSIGFGYSRIVVAKAGKGFRAWSIMVLITIYTNLVME